MSTISELEHYAAMRAAHAANVARIAELEAALRRFVSFEDNTDDANDREYQLCLDRNESTTTPNVRRAILEQARAALGGAK